MFMKLIVCLIYTLPEDEYLTYCSNQSTKLGSKVQRGHGSVSSSVALGKNKVHKARQKGLRICLYK